MFYRIYTLLQDDLTDFFRNEGQSGLMEILSGGLQRFTVEILRTAKPGNRVRFLEDYALEIGNRNHTQLEDFLVLYCHKVQVAYLGVDEDAHSTFNWQFIELPSAQGKNIFSTEHTASIASVSEGPNDEVLFAVFGKPL